MRLAELAIAACAEKLRARHDPHRPAQDQRRQRGAYTETCAPLDDVEGRPQQGAMRLAAPHRFCSRLAGATVLLAALALAFGGLAAQASAQTTPSVQASMQTGGGEASDFSWNGSTPMARNITVSVAGFSDGWGVWVMWQDVTAGTLGQAPWIATGTGTVEITWIPRSACGHRILISAGGGIDSNGSTFPASGDSTVLENCGAMIWPTATGIAGDGFTPGGQATVTVSSPSGIQLSSQTLPVSNYTGGTSCIYSLSGTKTCHTVPYNYTTEGQIGDALPELVPCGDTITATDLRSGQSDSIIACSH
jgi:hypothetical protein